MFDEEDDGFPRRRNRVLAAELDITPMIDVTFLLLIFFMVTSTMHGTPDKDIPPALSGSSRNANSMMQLIISPPSVAGSEVELMLDGVVMSLDEVRKKVGEQAASDDAEIMITAERRVPNGSIGEVESALSEVENLKYHFAVQDRR